MYTSGAKQYWIAWSVKHEKKRKLQVSLTPKKGPHTLHSVKKYKSLQKRTWKLIFFNYQGIKAKEHAQMYQLEHCIVKRKKENWIQNLLCIESKLILLWFKFIFLLPGNGKYTEIRATLPSTQKASILKTTVYMYMVV